MKSKPGSSRESGRARSSRRRIPRRRAIPLLAAGSEMLHPDALAHRATQLDNLSKAAPTRAHRQKALGRNFGILATVLWPLVAMSDESPSQRRHGPPIAGESALRTS